MRGAADLRRAMECSAMQASYGSVEGAKRRLRSAPLRSLSIWCFIIQARAGLFLLDQKWSYPGGFDDAKKSRRATVLGAWLRDNMLALGPTFIKIGQLFSARSDLLAPEVVNELSKLQDRVPSFRPGEGGRAVRLRVLRVPVLAWVRALRMSALGQSTVCFAISYPRSSHLCASELARKIVERELGGRIEDLFASFDAQPIAAASLGQARRGCWTFQRLKQDRLGCENSHFNASFHCNGSLICKKSTYVDDFTALLRVATLTPTRSRSLPTRTALTPPTLSQRHCRCTALASSRARTWW